MPKDDVEHSIPEAWLATLRQIANAFAAGDFQLGRHSIDGVDPVPLATAQHIAQNVRAYGQPLASLSDETCESSVCRWRDGFWQVLVDLTTEAEPVSDLTPHLKLYEADDNRWEMKSVHVP